MATAPTCIMLASQTAVECCRVVARARHKANRNANTTTIPTASGTPFGTDDTALKRSGVRQLNASRVGYPARLNSKPYAGVVGLTGSEPVNDGLKGGDIALTRGKRGRRRWRGNSERSQPDHAKRQKRDDRPDPLGETAAWSHARVSLTEHRLLSRALSHPGQAARASASRRRWPSDKLRPHYGFLSPQGKCQLLRVTWSRGMIQESASHTELNWSSWIPKRRRLACGTAMQGKRPGNDHQASTRPRRGRSHGLLSRMADDMARQGPRMAVLLEPKPYQLHSLRAFCMILNRSLLSGGSCVCSRVPLC